MTTSGRSFHLLAVQEVCISNLRKGMNRSERIAAFQVLTVKVISFGKQKVLKFLDYLINPFLADFSILHILKTQKTKYCEFSFAGIQVLFKGSSPEYISKTGLLQYIVYIISVNFSLFLIIKPKKKT